MTNRRWRRSIGWWLLLLVWMLAVGLRLALALVNTSANDDHLAVSAIMVHEGRIPVPGELWQSYHPKLYHTVVAVLWKGLGLTSPLAVVRMAQLVNVAAGVMTLVLVWWWLKERRGVWWHHVLLFSLVALNPRLIGINGQATNDSFAILFGTVTLWFGWRFFRWWRERDFAGMLVGGLLAGLTKGNGLVMIGVVLATLGMAVLRRAERRSAAVALFGFGVAVVLVVPWLGSYVRGWNVYDRPLAISVPPAPWPHLWQETQVRRPGVLSVASALLTFRLVDMVRSPQITNGPLPVSRHRTSLWSQLYGRTHFVHFDAWPPAWQQSQAAVQWLGRLVLVLALLPLAWGISGVGLIIREFWGRWRDGVRERWPLGQWFFGLAVVGWLCLGMYFSLRYRDFSAMKAIYIMPGLLAGVWVLQYGIRWWFDRWAKRELVVRGLVVVLGMLLLLYVVDISILIHHLWLAL